MVHFVLSFTIFWRLVLAHLIADFTLQTNRMAAWKRESFWGTLAHSLLFGLCAAILCWPQTINSWQIFGARVVLPGWVVIFIIMALHFCEDQWRVLAIRKHEKEDSFAFFVWDQGFHIGVIALLSPAFAGVMEKWVLLAILAVFATHFLTIFIYYLEKRTIGEAQIVTGEKYWFMAERLAIMSAVMLPGWWAASFIAVWLIRPAASGVGGRFYFKTKSFFGNLIALACGIIARCVMNA
jgi:hypothetical protein